MAVDLKNLRNMFLMTYTSETFDQLTLWYEAEKNGINCKIYQVDDTLVVTFSPFQCENLVHYLYNGGQIVWKQDMIYTDFGAVNRFFYETSAELTDSIIPKIKSKKLIITGMSLGGALGQAFYVHLRKRGMNPKTTIHAFGSPRIGDHDLRHWFMSQKNLEITNYGLFELVKGLKKIDPVCLFPSRKYGEYVNNPNLVMLFRKRVYKQADYNIDQPDTQITLLSVLCNCGIDKESSKLWDLIHDTDKYFDNLN